MLAAVNFGNGLVLEMETFILFKIYNSTFKNSN
jgi:hypothetical protein